MHCCATVSLRRLLVHRQKRHRQEQRYAVPEIGAKTDGTLDDTMALKIIEIIRSKPDITLDQLSAEAGIARRTLVRYMSDLKDAGRIERVGGKRYGRWKINWASPE